MPVCTRPGALAARACRRVVDPFFQKERQIGLGKRAQLTFDRLCEAAVAPRIRDLPVDRCALPLPTSEGLSRGYAAQALAEGSLLGLYRFLQ